MQAVKDSSHLYEVERRARHAERPGFRISELQLSPTQQVPWHYHTNIQDTFYVLEGEIRLFLREPKEDVRLKPGDVAIGISHSGRTAITVEGLRVAREKGALTIGISNYPRSPLREASSLFFCTSFPENRVKVAAISSKVAQMCILDALYLLVARHKEGLWDVERINALTERMMRLKTRR